MDHIQRTNPGLAWCTRLCWTNCSHLAFLSLQRTCLQANSIQKIFTWMLVHYSICSNCWIEKLLYRIVAIDLLPTNVTFPQLSRLCFGKSPDVFMVYHVKAAYKLPIPTHKSYTRAHTQRQKPPRKKDAPICSPAIGYIPHSMELYHIKTTEIVVSDFLCFDFMKIATSLIKIQKSQEILPITIPWKWQNTHLNLILV